MENQCKMMEDEHNKMLKIINFRLPHLYKKVGIIGAVAAFIFLLGYKFYGGESILVKDICRSAMVVLLLIASLSKDLIEDEYIQHVRSQSYVLSFICAVTYSIGLPLIALVMDVLITKISGDGQVGFHEVSAFEVMFMLVAFQLLFFETMKRFGRA